MITSIKNYYKEHPYKSIIFVGAIVLLLASIFSEGYGMHDDHFLIIETASSWSDGYDYNDWLPWNQTEELTPYAKGHSFTYTGFIFLLFEAMQSLGLNNPKIQMFIIRLFQSGLWLIAVSLALKITRQIGSEKSAKTVGWLMTLGAFIPFLAVRNLVEMTCVPFLLGGIWFSLKETKHWKNFLFAGLLFGLAFSVRFQVALFIAVYGVMLLFKIKFKHALLTLAGIVITISLTQGLVDYFIWGKPLEEFLAYVEYNNSDHKYDYAKGMSGIGYATYFIILANMSVPVIGVFYWFGLLRHWKKLFYLVIPLLVFVAFHSYYPNRQERFIFPMIPIFLIAGVAGWEYFRSKSKFWNQRERLWRKISTPFFVISIAIGITSAFVATKKSRVDAAYFFYGKENISYVIKEHPNSDTPMTPWHYANQWEIPEATKSIEELEHIVKENPEFVPDYILSYNNDDFEERMKRIKKLFPEAQVIEECNPSWFDLFLYRLNPNGNKNEVIRIVKT